MDKPDFPSACVWKPQDDKKLNPPQPLFREMPPAQPYPLDCLGSVMQAAATEMNETIQAPSALCGQSLLGAAALAVQPHADIHVDGRTKPISLFLLTVGLSGERKSGIDSEALKPHREFERRKIQEQEQALILFENEIEAWELAKKITLQKNRKGTPKEISRALEELGHRPQSPPSEIMIMDEPTLEGMQKGLASGRPSIGIFSDEGGRMIGGHGMSSDNQLKTAAGMCLLWDGSPMSRVRAADGSTKIFGKRLSLHLMFQPRVAEQLTSNQLLMDQGLLSRCLIVAPESTVGSRPYISKDLSKNKNVVCYRERMREILETPLPISNGRKNELTPRKLELCESDKNLWISFHDHIEKLMKDGGEFQSIRGFACKAAEQTLRISAVLSLVEKIDAREVSHGHLESSIALMEFYLSEALRLYNGAMLNPDLLQAQKLLVWCQQFEAIYPTQIYQRGPNSLREKAVAMKYIQILEEHGWLIKIPNGFNLEGSHRKEAWAVIK